MLHFECRTNELDNSNFVAIAFAHFFANSCGSHVHKLVWEHAQARVFDVTMILFHQLRTTFRHVDQDRQLLTAHCGVGRPTHVFTFLDNEISMMILGVHAGEKHAIICFI